MTAPVDRCLGARAPPAVAFCRVNHNLPPAGTISWPKCRRRSESRSRALGSITWPGSEKEAVSWPRFATVGLPRVISDQVPWPQYSNTQALKHRAVTTKARSQSSLSGPANWCHRHFPRSRPTETFGRQDGIAILESFASAMRHPRARSTFHRRRTTDQQPLNGGDAHVGLGDN